MLYAISKVARRSSADEKNLQPISMAPEYDHDSSYALMTSEQANATLALSPSMISAPSLWYADRKAPFALPGWVNKKRPVRMEKPWAATV